MSGIGSVYYRHLTKNNFFVKKPRAIAKKPPTIAEIFIIKPTEIRKPLPAKIEYENFRATVCDVGGERCTTFESVKKALPEEDRDLFLPLISQAALCPLTEALFQRAVSNFKITKGLIPNKLESNKYEYTFKISTTNNTLEISYKSVFSSKLNKHQKEADSNKVTFDASIKYDLNKSTCTYSHLPASS